MFRSKGYSYARVGYVMKDLLHRYSVSMVGDFQCAAIVHRGLLLNRINVYPGIGLEQSWIIDG